MSASDAVPELIDILDQDGHYTGLVKPKADVHRDGDWHRAVHVWFMTANGRVLMQRRSLTKENNPGKWDVSVAGHISAGEASAHAAVREVAEEIGLTLRAYDLRFIFSVVEEQILNNGSYIDREFHDVYLVNKDVDPATLSFKDGEVDEVRYVTLPELRAWVAQNKDDLVPHPDEYARLFDTIWSKDPV